MAFRIPQLNSAKSFLDRVLEKVPDGERDALRSDYSRAQDELSTVGQELEARIAQVNAKAKEQADWWDANKHLADAKPGDGKIAAAVDAEAIKKELTTTFAATAEQLASNSLALSTLIPTLVAQHGVEFGEVLDAEKLAEAAMKAGKDLRSYYHASVADRRTAKATEKHAADIAAAEARGREAAMKEVGNMKTPYPTSLRQPTTLSGLRTPQADVANPYSLEAAVATANERIAAADK